MIQQVSALEACAIFEAIQPYLRIQPYRRDSGARKVRHRIEFYGVPRELIIRAIAATMPCVSCGDPIHPFRVRKTGRDHRMPEDHHGFYFACACPLDKRIACSRTAAAAQEYEAVVRRLGPDRP